MGFLLVLISTPICYKAFRESTDANDILGTPNLSTAGKHCISAKGVLWVSELNRLDYNIRYIKHHLGSIGFLLYYLYIEALLRVLYAFTSP